MDKEIACMCRGCGRPFISKINISLCTSCIEEFRKMYRLEERKN